MANPQTENGYTKISNEILDHLIKTKINENCWQLVLFIIRKTYGFNKKQDKISLSQFVLATQLKKSVVCRGLTRLKNMNIIIRIANDDCTIYRFNKDFDTWKPLAKLLTLAKQQTNVSRIANESLAKQRHTKERYTKETLKELSNESSSLVSPDRLKKDKSGKSPREYTNTRRAELGKPPIKTKKLNDKQKIFFEADKLGHFYLDEVQRIHGTRPSFDYAKSGKNYKLAEKRLKEYGLDKCKQFITSHLMSDTDLGMDFSICLSSHVINKTIIKKPIYKWSC